MVPMCVSTCICRANVFGDPDDPQSLIHNVIKENKGKIKVLTMVKGAGEVPMKPADLKGKRPEEISKAIGYPGSVPVFADSAKTKPRVFYILP
jgi:Fe-S-cluster-containing dehydrogenase component